MANTDNFIMKIPNEFMMCVGVKQIKQLIAKMLKLTSQLGTKTRTLNCVTVKQRSYGAVFLVHRG